jgi:ABC-type phosphate transport system substrate-binding protein
MAFSSWQLTSSDVAPTVSLMVEDKEEQKENEEVDYDNHGSSSRRENKRDPTNYSFFNTKSS